MKYFRIVFITIFLNWPGTLSLQAQDPMQGDSLIFYLTSIHSAKDTNIIQKTFSWFAKSNEAVLLNNNISHLLKSMEGKIDENNYVDLNLAYLGVLTDLNTAAANEKAIAFGKSFVARYKNQGSKYAYYSFLTFLRNIRLPLRNSGKVTELISYYSQLDQHYHVTNDSAAVSVVNNVLSGTYFRLGMLERGQYYQLKSISYLDNQQLDHSVSSESGLLGIGGKANRYAVLGGNYLTEGKTVLADSFFNIALQFYHQLDDPLTFSDAPFLFLQIARCKTLQKEKNSAVYYDTALFYLRLYNAPPIEYAHFYQEKAADFITGNQLDSAMACIQQSKKLKDSFHFSVSSYMGELQPLYYLAAIFLKKAQPVKAIEYLQEDLTELKQFKFRSLELRVLRLLAGAYADASHEKEAYQTIQQAFTLKEKISADESESRSLSFGIEKKIQENETTILLLDQQNRNNRKKNFYLIGIVSTLGLLALALGIFYTNKRKSNRRLILKHEKLANTLDQLKATQSQLIQSEKMASLGELTAGIAHEIQNPLNFVNNFSEVNAELIEELVEEVDKGNVPQVKAIAKDIKENEERINHHGKRADAIVKGMLQHSRSSTGQKEPTDINALCDEYFRLAYHGLRAKDKSFNATLKTDFDDKIGNINIIPQDIGRVMLNLITNAFYAVNEKALSAGSTPIAAKYEPAVSISTEKRNNKVEISVADNGKGIPSSIKDKIFQPFFTTKPTGQGTGLGLSLAYDIVKAHGGELKVETIEGEGTTFLMHLPIL